MPQKRSKKRTRRRNIILVIVILFALVATAGAAGWLKKDKEISVTLAKAQKRDIIEKVSASGTIQPEKEVKISPDVPGEIIELNVKEGDSVQSGKLLIKLKPDNFEAALSRSEAVLNQSQANYADAQARLARTEAQLIQLKAAFDTADRDADVLAAKVYADPTFHDLRRLTQSLQRRTSPTTGEHG
jgi:HlyD family secretion protein